MATTFSFSEKYILSDLVDWFNALPSAQRIIKSLDLPFFNVKVVQDANATVSIIVGDASIGIDEANFLGEATFTWIGGKHATIPQTATVDSFYEVSKYIPGTTSSGGGTVTPVDELVIKVDSLADFVDGSLSPSFNKLYYLAGYIATGDGGEGFFRFDPSMAASAHNGGTIISFQASYINQPTFEDYLIQDLSTQVSGCFVRIRPSKTYLGEWFGVFPTSTTTENMADRIQAMVQAVGLAGGGDCLVDGGSPMFMDSVVSVEYNNVHLRINREMLMGPNGYLRLFGGLDEYRKSTDLCALSADSYTDSDGRLVLPVRTGEGAQFLPGDRIVIRGQQAASSISLEKQVTIVASVVGDLVTCVDEPEFSFKRVYPNSDYPGDRTIGTLISFVRYTAMKTDITTATPIIPCLDVSQFAIGDLVRVEDSRVENDFDSIVPYFNACNMETLKIVDIDYTANTVTLERSVKRPYLTSYQAGISKILPITNCTLQVGTATWSTLQATKSSIVQCVYGNNCTLIVGNIVGHDGRRGAAARIGDSYRCMIKDSGSIGAASYGSGEGYGFTMYYSTYCSIVNSFSASSRHNFLLQASTDCSVTECISDDDYISGIDCHGCLCIGTRIVGNRIGRANHFADTTLGAAIRIGNSSHALGDVESEVSGNIISGYKTTTGTGAAVDVVPSSSNTVIRNNSFVDCDKGVRLSPNRADILPEHTTDVIHVQNNTFIRVDELCSINKASTGEVNQVLFTGNISYGNSAQFEFSNITSLLLMDNKVLTPKLASATGFKITNVANLVASNNYAALTVGISTTGVTNGRVIRNLFGDSTTPTSFAVSDNIIAFHNDNSAGSSGGGTGGIEGVNLLKDATSVSTITTDINFTGGGVSLTKTGDKAVTVNIPLTSAGITVQDEGTTNGTGIQTLNFVGSNVVTTTSGTTSTVTVLNSGGSSGAGIPYKKTIAIYGDSITANNYAVGLTPEVMKSNGYWTWASIFTGSRIRFPRWNFGVGGDTTTMALARINDVVSVQPDYVYVGIGTNDYLKYNQGGPATPADSIANLTTIYDTLQAAGCFIIAPTLYAPTTAYNAFNATQLDFLNQINNFIRAQQFTRDNFEVLDLELTFADPAEAMPRAKANYTIDGLHPGTMGAFIYGQKIAEIIKNLEPFERNELFVHKSNTWTTTNIYGNLIKNAEIVGSTGTVSGTGISGVCATSWRLDKVADGGMTGVGSIETGTDLPGMNKQVIVVGGSTLTADDAVMFSQIVTYTDGTNFAPGDWIEAIADIEVINPVSIACVGLDIRIQSTTEALKYASSVDAQGTNATPVISSLPNGVSFRATFRTPPVQVSANVVNIRPRIVIDGWQGTSPSATIKVSRVVFRKAQIHP